MTKRHRDFGSSKAELTKPLGFSIMGEEFTCVPEAPAGVLNDLVAGISTNDAGDRVYSAPNLISFVIGVLREERPVPVDEAEALGIADAEVLTAEEARRAGHEVDEGLEKVAIVAADDVLRFYQLCRDKRRVLPLETLAEVVIWLAEEMMGRPLVPPGPSRRGRR